MGLFGTLFTIPDATTTITAVGAYSTTWFTEFLPVVYLIVGVAVAALAIRFLARVVKGGAKGVLGSGRRGRRRGRR